MKTFVTKTMYTETAHRLVDYPDGRCQHLHGHSYKWEVTVGLLGKDDVDSRGMVVDFKDLKEAMMLHIDKYDHALILSDGDPLVSRCLNLADGGVREILESTAGNPPRLFAVPFNPTAENLAKHVAEELNTELNKMGAYVERVVVWETATSSAVWNIEHEEA